MLARIPVKVQNGQTQFSRGGDLIKSNTSTAKTVYQVGKEFGNEGEWEKESL